MTLHQLFVLCGCQRLTQCADGTCARMHARACGDAVMHALDQPRKAQPQRARPMNAADLNGCTCRIIGATCKRSASVPSVLTRLNPTEVLSWSAHLRMHASVALGGMLPRCTTCCCWHMHSGVLRGRGAGSCGRHGAAHGPMGVLHGLASALRPHSRSWA